jgi:epoxyqueuosine reductase
MKNTILPKELLESLGVLDWGYTDESKPRSFKQYEKWIQHAHHGSLGYLADHRKNLRSDLKLIYPEFKSALVFLFSYQPTKKWMLEHNRHEVAAYSLGFGGADYHHALKRRLEVIASHLKIKAVISLDTQPVLERDLALRAGLGWFGKNSMLINRQHGSYFIIGSLLLDYKLPIPSEKVETDHCGHCMACVEACPTQAIDPETRSLIASQCISTFTIEIMKDAEAPKGFDHSRGEIFGCDICQDVCPWNKKPLNRINSELRLEERFKFLKELLYETPKAKLQEIILGTSGRGWKKILKGTALERPGKEGWLKNFKSNRSDL